jgi:hypothetical protein
MLLPTIFSRCQVLKFSRPKNLPLADERQKKDQEILKDLMSVVNSDLSDKFKYVKSINFEEQDVMNILEVMQRYLRKLLLAKTGVEAGENDLVPLKNSSVKRIKDILNLIENINYKLLFTNANPKLALEILLMEL